MNNDLNYIADTIVLETFFSNDNLIKNAGVMSSIGQGVVDQIKSIYDPNKPAASIASFIAEGALFRFLPGNLKILAVLYPLAEALGFDWKGFWSSLAKGIYSFINGVKSNNTKGSPEDIDHIVRSSVENSLTGQEDKQKLQELAKSNPTLASRKKDIIFIKNSLSNFSLRKEASLKTKLFGFLITLVSWILKTSFASLALTAGVGAVSGLLGLNKGKKERATGQDPDNTARTVSDEASSPSTPNSDLASKLKISPEVSQELFSNHSNDSSNIWIERGDINSLEQTIMAWILNAYPQLQKVQKNIASSQAFSSIISQFDKRNKYANGLGIFAVPKEYTRKIDIVYNIVNSFLQQYTQNHQEDKEHDTKVNYK